MKEVHALCLQLDRLVKTDLVLAHAKQVLTELDFTRADF